MREVRGNSVARKLFQIQYNGTIRKSVVLQLLAGIKITYIPFVQNTGCPQKVSAFYQK